MNSPNIQNQPKHERGADSRAHPEYSSGVAGRAGYEKRQCGYRTKSGVSLGNAYHYFRSKEELIQRFTTARTSNT